MASLGTSSFRTLVRPSVLPSASRIHPILRISRAAAPFSTSSFVAAADPPTISSRRDLPKKVKKTFKKKAHIAPVKKPNPGERKAFRKRIQLSNNSALPVEGIEDLSPAALADPAISGKMVAIPDSVVDQLRALEAFKTTQTWNLFRRPHFLVRRETVELMRMMTESVDKKEALKCVLRGRKLSGKSLTLLQAMAYGLMNEWVVLHIPEGRVIVLGWYILLVSSTLVLTVL